MQRRMFLAGAGGLGLTGLAGPAFAAGEGAAAPRPITPTCDHHQHLLSPMAAARENARAVQLGARAAFEPPRDRLACKSIDRAEAAQL